MGESLHERIRGVLEEVATYRFESTSARACVAAAAPGLLAEAVVRLDPGDTDVAELVRELEFMARGEENLRWGRTGGEAWNAHAIKAERLRAAARLLEQVFLTPKEGD